ncbi:hypothetical protein FJZ31_20265 [Candidatus Poribacteria bacterium]|nr:hypothetical protein [Candidatus Poribacteria bacterium]
MTIRTKGVTLRAVMLGLALIPINLYFIMNNHIYWNALPTTISLFFNVIISIFVLTTLNLPLQKYMPKYALSQGELLTIYIMLSVASAIAGHDMMQTVVPTIPHAFWFATPENEWKELFWRYLPRWLVADDLRGLRDYYRGESSFYLAEHVKTWLRPIFGWMLLLSALLWVMICINIIIRKQWIESERLSYPIIQLPVEMTKGSAIFKTKMLWIGFAIAGGIDLINGLHYLFPVLPYIPVRDYEIGGYFTSKPWNAIGWTPMFVLSFAVGLGYLIPLEMSFSLWFFYLFWKGERILGNMLGLRSLPDFPYDGPQAMGAYFGLIMLSLWVGKRHLLFVLKCLIRSHPAERDEPLRYRTAVLGLIGGVIVLTVLSLRGGMSLWVVFVYFLIYYLLSMSITRIRAEVGPPTHEMFVITPQDFFMQAIGARRLSPGSLTIIAMYWTFNRGYRAHPMPHTLEAFKLAEQAQMNSRRVTLALALAVVVGVLSSFWAYLEMSYRLGGRPDLGEGGYSYLRSWLYYPSTTDYSAMSFMGIGFIFTFLVWMLRMRFPLWPLHPAGYAIASSTWTFGWLWFSVFIAWTVKTIILKHGGIGMYRRTMPLFLGLILGDYLVGGGWAIVRLLFGIDVYIFYR